MCLHRRSKQPPEAQHLYQAGERFWLSRMTLKPFQQSTHGLIGVASIDLHERKELMSRRQVRIEGEGSLQGGVGQFQVCAGVTAEFVEEPATSTEPSPGRCEGGILRQA